MSDHKSVGAFSALCLSGSLVDEDFEQGVAGQQLPEVDFEKHLMFWGRTGVLRAENSEVRLIWI